MQEIGSKPGEATALMNLGSVHQKIGKRKEAKQFLQKALRITRRIGDKGTE